MTIETADPAVTDGIHMTGILLHVEINERYTNKETGQTRDPFCRALLLVNGEPVKIKYPISAVQALEASKGQRVSLAVECYSINDRNGNAQLYFGAPKNLK